MAGPSGMGVALRVGLWVVVSGSFLLRDLFIIHAAQVAGKPVTTGMVLQLLLWMVVLGFWIVLGIRSWRAQRLAAARQRIGS